MIDARFGVVEMVDEGAKDNPVAMNPGKRNRPRNFDRDLAPANHCLVRLLFGNELRLRVTVYQVWILSVASWHPLLGIVVESCPDRCDVDCAVPWTSLP